MLRGAQLCCCLLLLQGMAVAQQDASHQPAKAKKIILIIGDGMGTTQIYAGLTANKGWLNLEQCRYVGLSKTNSASHYITESSAGATAIATGQKTYNGAIGVDTTGRPIPTILEIAEKHGLSTGLVVSGSITGATPAAFIAHQPSRNLTEQIAADFLKTEIDVFIGSGERRFNKRSDGRNLIKELEDKGYVVSSDINEILNVKYGKLAGFVGNQLIEGTRATLGLLNQNEKGFFLMIEEGSIDTAGHENDSARLIEAILNFDRLIGEVLSFAKADGEILVIITADHETGGLTLVDGSLRTGEVRARFSTDDHTSVMVPVFAYGPGAEAFIGIYHNNTIFDKMMNAFGF